MIAAGDPLSDMPGEEISNDRTPRFVSNETGRPFAVVRAVKSACAGRVGVCAAPSAPQAHLEVLLFVAHIPGHLCHIEGIGGSADEGGGSKVVHQHNIFFGVS